jgi:tetratricopeptide (TPR) repeat protein
MKGFGGGFLHVLRAFLLDYWIGLGENASGCNQGGHMRTAFRSPLPVLASALLTALLAGGCSPAVRGSIALSSGDYKQALGNYNEALAKDPGSIPLRQRIGLTYFAMKDYDKAETSFQDILQRSPGEPNALFYLGLTRIGKGEAQSALTDLTRFQWPFKYYQQKFVREEAERLLRHPEATPDEAIRSLQDELEKGRQEQLRFEIESERMLSN